MVAQRTCSYWQMQRGFLAGSQRDEASGVANLGPHVCFSGPMLSSGKADGKMTGRFHRETYLTCVSRVMTFLD